MWRSCKINKLLKFYKIMNILKKFWHSIATRFIPQLLAVSLRKTKQFDSKYDNWFVGMRYDNFEQLEKERKFLKERTMTYITSGMINHKPFLMVDCVAKSRKDKSLHFTKKLNRLLSTKIETYFCLTGIDGMQRAISIFDRKCYENNVEFDFRNEDHINEILEIYKLLINKWEYNNGFEINNHFNRVYFINKEGVNYFQIDDEMKLWDLIEIPNNKYIKPQYSTNQPIKFDLTFNNCDELINTCWNEILKIQDSNINLKNRFSFIMFDNEQKIYVNPCRNNEEIILEYVGGNYSELK